MAVSFMVGESSMPAFTHIDGETPKRMQERLLTHQ
jgi:hypothetical protein